MFVFTLKSEIFNSILFQSSYRKGSRVSAIWPLKKTDFIDNLPAVHSISKLSRVR